MGYTCQTLIIGRLDTNMTDSDLELINTLLNRKSTQKRCDRLGRPFYDALKTRALTLGRADIAVHTIGSIDGPEVLIIDGHLYHTIPPGAELDLSAK